MVFDRKTIWITVASASVLTLGAANLAGSRNPAWPTGWYELAPRYSEDKPPFIGSWHIDVGDLPLVELASLSGKIKFISSAKPTWEKCKIGYVVDLHALPIPKDKIPESYKNSPPAKIMYEVNFEFQLIDVDGFEIMSLESPSHILMSGETKRIQSQTEPAVTTADANRLSAVNVAVSVNKAWIVTDSKAPDSP